MKLGRVAVSWPLVSAVTAALVLAATSTAMPLALLLLYVMTLSVHETGHVLACRAAHTEVRLVQLGLTGGATRWAGTPTPLTVIAISVAGPVANLCAAAAASALDARFAQPVVAINVATAAIDPLPIGRHNDGRVILDALRPPRPMHLSARSPEA